MENKKIQALDDDLLLNVIGGVDIGTDGYPYTCPHCYETWRDNNRPSFCPRCKAEVILPF